MTNEDIKWIERTCDELVARRMENTGESFEDAARHIAQYLIQNHSPKN